MKVIVTIPEQYVEYDFDEEDFTYEGELDKDGLYDSFVHDALQQVDYHWEVED